MRTSGYRRRSQECKDYRNHTRNTSVGEPRDVELSFKTQSLGFKVWVFCVRVSACREPMVLMQVFGRLDFEESEDTLADMLDRYSAPLLVAYRYPSASCGPKAQGVEGVHIVHRCAGPYIAGTCPEG